MLPLIVASPAVVPRERARVASTVRTWIAVNAFLQERITGMSMVQLSPRGARRTMPSTRSPAAPRANVESIFYYPVFDPAIELVESAWRRPSSCGWAAGGSSTTC